MESRAKLFGHSIHAMLIVFPVGLFVTAVIFDVIHLLTGNGPWALASDYMIGAGLIGGLVAAVFGFVDYLAIPAGTRAKSVGRTHGLGAKVIVGRTRIYSQMSALGKTAIAAALVTELAIACGQRGLARHVE